MYPIKIVEDHYHDIMKHRQQGAKFLTIVLLPEVGQERKK